MNCSASTADGMIYISKACFEEGFEKLVGTLYEEYVHAHYAVVT